MARTTLRLGLVVTAVILGAIAAPAVAQDQTVILPAPPTPCRITPPSPLVFTEDDAAALIASITGSAPEWDKYYLINAVSFTGAGLAIGEQKWFVYFKPWHDAKGILAHWLDARVKKRFEEERIFGSRKLALVYVMNGVPVIDRATAQKSVLATLTASIHTPALLDNEVALAELKKELALGLRFPGDDRREVLLAKALGVPTFDAKTSPAVLHQALAQVMTENLIVKEFDSVAAASNFNLVTTTGEPLSALTPNLLSTQPFAALRDLRYRVDVTKKEPFPLLNLKSVLSFIAQATPRDLAVPLSTTSMCGVVPFSIAPLPSDVKVTAIARDGQDEKELGKATYDNERKYWFDFGFALPLKSYDDLTVDVDAGQVGAKEVKKTDLYAAITLNPVPYDTKKPHWHWVPGVVYGMPITGKPLKRHLLAVSIGLTRAQVFAGVLFSKNETVTADSQGGVTTAVIAQPDEWTRTFTWGINLSAKTVTDLFKK